MRGRAPSCLGIVLLALGLVLSPLRAAAAEARVELPPHPAGLAWPTGAWPRGELPAGLDRATFERSVEALFASRSRGGPPDTRALLVVHRGRLVFERYAEGFDPDSRFQSWSMAKSVTNAFAGILVRRGELVLDAPVPVSEWSGEGDPRSGITLRHLLQMRSGLANADGFGGTDMGSSFLARMIFGEGALAPGRYAAAVPLAVPIGEHWAYSTASSTLIARIAGEIVGGGARDTMDFLQRELFVPLGMHSAQPEFAQSGTFLGGVFFHATARDWARFGYLYLRDGVWDGRRILPEGWVDFSRSPSPTANNGVHGAHFWINAEPAAGQWELLPGGPREVFAAEGAQFQMVAIAPARDLVAVRLGLDQGLPFREIKRPFGPLVGAFPVQP